MFQNSNRYKLTLSLMWVLIEDKFVDPDLYKRLRAPLNPNSCVYFNWTWLGKVINRVNIILSVRKDLKKSCRGCIDQSAHFYNALKY